MNNNERFFISNVLRFNCSYVSNSNYEYVGWLRTAIKCIIVIAVEQELRDECALTP